MRKYLYDSNNSGGDWWLEDQDWKNLEAAGWKVKWYNEGGSALRMEQLDEEGNLRFLGALATSATKSFETIDDAIAEFEEITGQDFYASGCKCCGSPHTMSNVDDLWEYRYG